MQGAVVVTSDLTLLREGSLFKKRKLDGKLISSLHVLATVGAIADFSFEAGSCIWHPDNE